jgi:hypothetical protein
MQLRAAEDRITQLEAEVALFRDRATRAEGWLQTIHSEIEQKLIAPRSAFGTEQTLVSSTPNTEPSEQIFPLGIIAVEALDRVLHRSSKLAVGTAELLQQHVAEFWIGRIDPDRVHELLDVMVHYLPRSVVSCGREASHLHQTDVSKGWSGVRVVTTTLRPFA